MISSVQKKETEAKQLEQLKSEIIQFHRDPELRDFKLKLLEEIGIGPYKSWFNAQKVHLRSGWFVIPVSNDWVKDTLTKRYSSLLKKLKIILQVEH